MPNETDIHSGKAIDDKKEIFCQQFMVDMSVGAAAVRAGYARSHGRILLRQKRIQDRIAELRADLTKRLQVTTDDIARELIKIGFCNIQDFIDVRDGNTVLLKTFSEIHRDKTAAISSIKVTSSKDGDSDVTEFKLHNKRDALVDLGRYTGMFERDNTQRAEQVQINIVPRKMVESRVVEPKELENRND